MNAPEPWKIADGYACYRPVGEVSLAEAIDLVSGAIVFAGQQRIANLLIAVAGLSGFEPPMLYERYFLMERFTFDAKGAVKVALVVKPEMIDPQRFGVLVGRNRGLRNNVFSDEAEALAWLLDPGTG